MLPGPESTTACDYIGGETDRQNGGNVPERSSCCPPVFLCVRVIYVQGRADVDCCDGQRVKARRIALVIVALQRVARRSAAADLTRRIAALRLRLWSSLMSIDRAVCLAPCFGIAWGVADRPSAPAAEAVAETTKKVLHAPQFDRARNLPIY